LFANRPTQYTPWGYSQWTTETLPDGTEQWSNTQGLTPELQDILNKQISIQGGKTDLAGSLVGRMGQEFGQAQDWSALNPMGQVPTAQYTLPENDLANPYETRQKAEDAMYNQAQSRLKPEFDSKRASLETKMRNQGLSPEDAAWKSQMGGLDRQETDANQQSIWGATQAGRDESGQMFNQGLQANQNTFNQALGANNQNWNQSLAGSQYANQIRQQQIAEVLQQRGSSLNEINALMNGGQVGMPQMPGFSQAGQAAPADYVGAAAQNASQANASNPWSSILGAGVSLGSAYLGA